MEIDKIIENGQGTIYHELGHLMGYILSNRSEVTSLGVVGSFELGLRSNCVVAKNSKYHFEYPFIEKDKVYENTSNIDRTVAWFLEVIAGCTFHACYEEKQFKFCFESNGRIDSDNLSAIRTLSAFKWTFDDIFMLQNELEQMVIKYKLIDCFFPLVLDLKKMLIEKEGNQIVKMESELDDLISQLENLIPKKFTTEYFNLISKYASKFNELRE